MADNHIGLYCLVDGVAPSNAFPVDIESTKTIGNLKDLIKTKKAPRFDDVAADELNLWHVSIPVDPTNMHTPIVLNELGLSTELCPTNGVSTIFAVQPPENTINIIVQRPPPTPDLFSEHGFVEHTLRDTIGANQSPPGSRTDTTRTYALTPAKVREWDNFFLPVLEMELTTEPRQYPRPDFHPLRTVSTEANLHDLFRVDVGSVRSLPDSADTHTATTTALTYGVPDLLCSRTETDGKLRHLFPIEMKRPAILHLNDDVSFRTAYGGSRSRARGPLKQLYGYMKYNGFRYGVLSTYTQTWFVKRDGNGGREALVSPTILFNRTVPTLLQCYLWLIRAASRDGRMKAMGRGRAKLSVTRGKVIGAVTKAKRTAKKILPRRGRAQQGSTTQQGTPTERAVMEQESITIPAFKNMELISQGEGARTFRASWENVDVMVKKADLWNQRLIVHELEREEKVYQTLKKLQGRYIPRMKVAGILNDMEMILVTEFVGTDLCEQQLNRSDRDKIRAALSAVHRLGVLHGDIRPQNIVANRDGQNSQFFIIDFGLSKFTRSKTALEREAEELDSLLSEMPWPDDKNC
ncbi:hypothetical protein EDD11_008793 [Mortierella claussenii]|nr:hypothetical protein EDD11_008793 [Mortierella claussenii]